jgi:hypothetical protein
VEKCPLPLKTKKNDDQQNRENEAKALFYSRVERLQSIKGNVQAA